MIGDERETMIPIRDWRQALRTPHTYRVGSSTLRIQSHFLHLMIGIVALTVLFFLYTMFRGSSCSEYQTQFCGYYRYNKTYPLSPAQHTTSGISYRIAIVSDLDKESRSLTKKDAWNSYLMKGHLYWSKNWLMSVTWDSDVVTLSSSLAMKGRGMELSELVVFDGKLLSFDDRTGLVYTIERDQAIPWIIMMDGNGKGGKGFKSEWATVKDEQLYIGSMGKEWTTSLGEYEHDNPMWVKVVSSRGEVHSLNWISNYKRLREAISIEFPGYMIHESGVWSDIHKSWFFLPRRCSKERYNETKDEVMSCNVLLTANEDFSDVKMTRIGELNPKRGFASFKFLPESEDSIIVALKTEEYQGYTATYITAFSIDGTRVMSEQKITEKKFEGFEFI